MAMISCLLILVGIATVSTAVDATTRPAVWGPARRGCRFSLTPDRPSYRFDQPIRLHLALENTGDKSVEPIESNLMIAYRFDIRRMDGMPVPLTIAGKQQEIAPIVHLRTNTLEPGQLDATVIPMLNRYYDMTLQGEYTVTVYRRIMPQTPDTEYDEVASNAVKIVVHDSDVENTTTKPTMEQAKVPTTMPVPEE